MTTIPSWQWAEQAPGGGKWKHKGTVPLMEFGNITGPTAPLPLINMRSKRDRKTFSYKLQSYRAAITVGEMSFLDAVQNLRKHYNLGLKTTVDLIRGDIDFPESN